MRPIKEFNGLPYPYVRERRTFSDYTPKIAIGRLQEQKKIEQKLPRTPKIIFLRKPCEPLEDLLRDLRNKRDHNEISPKEYEKRRERIIFKYRPSRRISSHF